MERIEIPVKDYYFAEALFPFMPRQMFDALEAAYLEGRPVAAIPAESFREFQKAADLC